MADLSVRRKGKELWLGGMMIADCASEGVAAVLLLAANRARIKQSEADIMMAVFNG